MGQIHHNKEAEINQNKYSYVIVFIILTYCFITKLTAIAMHGNKIPYNVASCDVAIVQSINVTYEWSDQNTGNLSIHV